MHLKFIKTKDDTLSKYLDGFYIMKKSTVQEDLKYLFFASNRIVLSIFKNAESKISANQLCISANPQSPFLAFQIFPVQSPISCTYKGIIKEISFCFTPLGLNHFLDHDLNHYFNKTAGPFLPFADYEEVMRQVLEESEENAIQEKIEQYWLSKLKPRNFFLLESLIHLLQSEESDTIQQISEKAKISRQHIARLFDTHLCRTPSMFRKIHRFRKTLANRIALLKRGENLTSLTYESLFYDQSHLIKDFRSFTGMSPKKFFELNKSFDNGVINWVFPD